MHNLFIRLAKALNILVIFSSPPDIFFFPTSMFSRVVVLRVWSLGQQDEQHPEFVRNANSWASSLAY